MEKHPDIYAYEDFRLYLADQLRYVLAKHPECSQRQIARDAGVANPGYLNDVIQGRRALSRGALDKFAPVLGLSSKETEFLRLLVEYAQSRRPEDKAEAYRQVLARRGRSGFARLKPAQARYYQDTRLPLLRAAVEACDFGGDFARLGAFVRPPQSPSATRTAVEQLVEWGLVERQGDQYRVTSRMLEPAPTLGTQVRALNRKWMQEASEAVEALPKERRHVSTALMAVSPQTRKLIQAKVEALRAEVFALLEAEENPTELWQLSLALIPRSDAEPL